MKKISPIVILVLFFLVAWNVSGHPSGMRFDFDGDDIDGPLGALAGLLFAGGGLIVAVLVMLFVGALLAVLFAGMGVFLGVMLALGLGLVALVVVAVVSPLLLPLLIPVAVIWFFASRARRNRMKSRLA
jgi:hypothetical protein